MRSNPGVNRIKLQILGSSDLDAGAHGGSDGAGTDILTLCCSGLCLDNSLDQSVHVLSTISDMICQVLFLEILW